MIVLLIGDVVGEAGLSALEAGLPAIIRRFEADFTLVNGENAAEGYGITEAAFRRILAAGADAVTSGNHVWEKAEFLPLLAGPGQGQGPSILRPANYPPSAPGRGFIVLEKNGKRLLAINLQGREYLTAIDCPFRTADGILAAHPDIPSVIDFHAESTREKEALGFYLDGRAGAVCGTHTHVQTADEKILPRGTAYITDLGMTGPAEGVIGMDTAICLERARTQVLYRMRCAAGPCSIQGAAVTLDETGKARTVERIADPFC